MNPAPRWFLPVAVIALIWNLMGCFAYLADVMVSAEDVAAMTEAQQTLYATRSWWTVSATAIAVWGGAAGCLGLILRKGWALPLLWASLVGLIIQDFGLFVLNNAASLAGMGPVVLQGLVLVIGIALVMLGRKAVANGWIGAGAATA
jgi:hypothetical protein